MANEIKIVERTGVNALKWHAPFMQGMGLVKKVDENTIPMWVADMEFAISPQIEQALVKTAQQGSFGYTLASGNREYTHASIGYYKRHYNWDVHPKDIVISTGTLKAIETVISLVTEEGDGVIVQEPIYTQFFSYIKGAKRRVVNNELIRETDSFSINFDELEAQAKDPRTKLMLLCNPHNPTGKVFTEDELRRIDAIMSANGVTIFSDEVHAGVLRKGVKHTPIASLSQDRTIITATDFSKTFNLGGMGITNVICRDRIFATKLKKAGIGGMPSTMTMASPFSMNALIAAYRDSDQWRGNMNSYIDGNFELVETFLAEHLPLVRFHIPQGTYFAWFDFSGYGLTAKEVSTVIAEKVNVALEYGEMFGSAGEHYQRMVLATSKEMVLEALRRLQRAFTSL